MLSLALAVSLTACSPSSPALDGRAFVSVDVVAGGAPKALVPGTSIALRFGRSDLGASAGCNSIGGTYRIEAGRLLFEGASMTEMGCDQPRHAQDDWLVAFLSSRPAILLVGNDLTLDGGGTFVRLLDREVAEPDLNIVGPTWTVEGLMQGDTVASAPGDATATLTFRANGTVDVDAGCNRGSGTWKLEGSGIAIAQLGLTKMACDGPRAELEAAVLAVLQAGSLAAVIDADSMTLQAGRLGLQLRGTIPVGG